MGHGAAAAVAEAAVDTGESGSLNGVIGVFW